MRKKLISLNLALIFILSLFSYCIPTAKAAGADDYGYATYHFNNGTDEQTLLQLDYFLTSNCNLTLYEAVKNATPAYPGHVLVGFSSTEDGEPAYRASDIIKNIFSTDASTPGIVYAQWEEVTDAYYVVYRCCDSNTTQGTDYVIATPATDNGKIELAAGSTFTTADGQSVVAWVTGSGLNRREFAPGSSAAVDSGTEFIAIMGSNYITFHDGEYENFRSYPEPDRPIGEVGRGRYFSGWNTNEDGSGVWYYPLSEAGAVPHDLYAQYIAAPSNSQLVLTSQFGLEGGPMSKLLDLSDGKATLPETVKDGQKAAYWYSTYFQERKYYPAGVPVSVEPGTVLEAQTISMDSYYGIVDGDGGLTVSGSPYYATACYVTSAGNLNLYSFNSLVTFTKDGSAVSGYQGGKTGNIYGFNDDIWAAMGMEAGDDHIARFTAQYEQLEGSYIQYLGNGATTADGKSYVVQSGLDFSDLSGATFAENSFTAPEGKYFLGWNTQSNGSGDWYDPGKPITLNANTVLYAQWGNSRVTYHYEYPAGTQRTTTHVDSDKITGNLSPEENTATDAVYSLARQYGLRNYLSVSPFAGYVTRLDSAKIIASLGKLNIDMSDTDLPFTDCDDLTTQEKAIVKAGLGAGVFMGTSSNTFSPNSVITRAEMTALIWRLLGLPEPEQITGSFQDVSPNHWYYQCVMSMKEKGIIITNRDMFEPAAPVTFLDAFRWAAAAYEYMEFGGVRSSDILNDSYAQTFFEGWNTQENGSGTWYARGDNISAGMVIDLYEKWVTAPSSGYYYVLTGHRMADGKTTNIVALDNMTATVSLPVNNSFYGWIGGGLSYRDIEKRKGFIDETENFYTCGETVVVNSGDIFRPLADSSGIFAVYNRNDGSSAAARTYFYIASHTSLELYSFSQVFGAPSAGKSFTSWNTNLGGNGKSYAAGASISDSVNLFAQWRSNSIPSTSGGGGGGGGYVPSTPNAPGTPSVTTGTQDGGKTTATTAKPTATTKGDTATVTINSTIGNEIVKQAEQNKSDNVIIAPEFKSNISKAEVSIPATTVGQIGTKTDANLTVSTPVANVTIPNGGLDNLSSAGGTVTIAAEKTGDTVELSMTSGGKSIDCIPGGVTLTVPTNTATPGTVAVLIHEDGTREVIRKSVVVGNNIAIPLDGAAKVEIVDNSKYFADVPAMSWAADAIAFVSAHELFNGTGENRFSPDLPMSRGMLAVVLHNLESNPDQALTGVFGDVDSSVWYAKGVTWAAANGIVSGYGDGRFGPNDNITREQLAVMLWRYAGSPTATNKELNFTDADKASGYALNALCWAVENGIINGYGNGQLGPQGLATRAQVAQMLKNYMKR